MELQAEPRIGIESEFVNMGLTFYNISWTQKTSVKKRFWPQISEFADLTKESTMMGRRPILVPQKGRVFVKNSVDFVAWEADDWGFVVIGDAFREDAIAGTWDGTTAPTNFTTCALELASAAHKAQDAAHWAFLRRCQATFWDTLWELRQSQQPSSTPAATFSFGVPTQRWYKLQDVVNRYNGKIASLVPPQGIDSDFFKLKFSDEIQSLADGVSSEQAKSIPGKPEGKWIPYIRVEDTVRCECQVNYTFSLSRLYLNADAWVNSWQHLWADSYGNDVMDPPSALVTQRPNVDHFHKHHIAAAIWRAARYHVDSFYKSNPIVGAKPDQVILIKALIMQLIAIGTINPVKGGTPKNSWTQLAKTSGASIAELLRLQGLNLAALASTSAVDKAEAFAMKLRDYKILISDGRLPKGSPLPGFATYEDAAKGSFVDGELKPLGLHSNFKNMWVEVFTGSTPLTEKNAFGFTVQSPFYCWWAADVHSSIAAQKAASDILVAFESRFAVNRLNLAFAPSANIEIFYRTYVEFISALKDDSEGKRVAAALDALDPVYVGARKAREVVYNALDQAQKQYFH